jgi:antitoxin component YwqK of YwqJK toxin-antitoxin module
LWYENGQLNWEGNYKEGKQEGLCIEYHEEECLYKEKVYMDGKLVSGTGWMEKMVKACN